MEGPWETTAQFRRDKGFPNWKKSVHMTQKMKGWSKEKRKMINKAAEEASKEMVEGRKNEAIAIRERQANIARGLQKKGIKALEYLDPKSAEEARRMIDTGLRQEREALGLNEKGGAKNLTQVNLNLPKTRFDKIIDGQDFQGILELLAEVRQERTRRIGKDSSGESQAKAN